jgi:hypothetical protein
VKPFFLSSGSELCIRVLENREPEDGDRKNIAIMKYVLLRYDFHMPKEERLRTRYLKNKALRS